MSRSQQRKQSKARGSVPSVSLCSKSCWTDRRRHRTQRRTHPGQHQVPARAQARPWPTTILKSATRSWRWTAPPSGEPPRPPTASGRSSNGRRITSSRPPSACPTTGTRGCALASRRWAAEPSPPRAGSTLPSAACWSAPSAPTWSSSTIRKERDSARSGVQTDLRGAHDRGRPGRTFEQEATE